MKKARYAGFFHQQGIVRPLSGRGWSGFVEFLTAF
jgi:hypothetical protein